jgi:choline dehydrogenase-like flavoprotein
MSNDANCFDFVVVGSGAGGGVLASRLARNRQLKVLLIEAGNNSCSRERASRTAVASMTSAS